MNEGKASLGSRGRVNAGAAVIDQSWVYGCVVLELGRQGALVYVALGAMSTPERLLSARAGCAGSGFVCGSVV